MVSKHHGTGLGQEIQVLSEALCGWLAGPFQPRPVGEGWGSTQPKPHPQSVGFVSVAFVSVGFVSVAFVSVAFASVAFVSAVFHCRCERAERMEV